MNYAARVNLVFALAVGVFVGYLAHRADNAVWVVWGVAAAMVASVGLACVQIASECSRREEAALRELWEEREAER